MAAEDGTDPAVTITVRNAPRKIVVLLDDASPASDDTAPSDDTAGIAADWMPDTCYCPDPSMSFDAAAGTQVTVTRSAKAPATAMAILIDGNVVPFSNGDSSRILLAPGEHHILATLRGGQGGSGTATVAGAAGELIALSVKIFGNAGQGFSEGRFDV